MKTRTLLLSCLVGLLFGALTACELPTNDATPDPVDTVDTAKPVITLLGSASVTVGQNASYVDAGATAADDADGNLTSKLVKGGTFVNTATIGEYTVTYDVSDKAGNSAVQRVRTVNVVAIVPLNKVLLAEQIALATPLLTGTGVGTAAGQVSQTASNALSDALGLAIAARDSTTADQAQVDSATTVLQGAIVAFRAAIVPVPPSGNLVVNGTFSVADDLFDNSFAAGQWSGWTALENGVTAAIVGGEAVLTVNAVGTQYGDNQFWQSKMTAPVAGTYVVTFRARASVATDINLRVQPTACAVGTQGDLLFRLSTEMKTYQASFDVFGMVAGASLELRFNLGKATPNSVPTVVTLDDVVLETATAPAATKVNLAVRDGLTPVVGAKVVVSGADAGVSGVEYTTDANGLIALDLQPRLYKLSLTKTGHPSLTTTVVVGSETSVSVDFPKTVVVPPSAAPVGVFSEAVTGMVVGTSGGFGKWTNGTVNFSTEETAEKAEGTKSLAVVYDANSIGGVFAYYSDTANEAAKTPRDLSGHAALSFAVKATVALTSFAVKLESAAASKELSNVPTTYGSTADTTTLPGWTVYTIPLADFAGVDLTQVTVPFSFWHPNNGYTGTVYLDDIRLN